MKSSPGPRTCGSATRGATKLLLALAFPWALLAGGCRSPHRPTPLDDRLSASGAQSPPISAGPSESRSADIETTPAWLTEPLSSEKLKQIWLVTDGMRASPEWRIEGELVLNLRRLEFARREAQVKAADAAGLAAHVRTAHAGLQRVMGEPEATPAQRERAKNGLARADRLIAQVDTERGTTTASSMHGLSVIGRREWGALPARTDRMEKNKGPYTRITVHHSADRDPPHLDGSLSASESEMRQIQKAHVEGKDTHYGDIGYHFVIDPSGRPRLRRQQHLEHRRVLDRQLRSRAAHEDRARRAQESARPAAQHVQHQEEPGVRAP